MIIWGTRGRETEIGTCSFYCPKCDSEKAYTHKKVASFFTLFFIPLFELKKLGEYLQCAGCNTSYKPEVLNFKPLTLEQRQLVMVKRDLESGTPVQMAQTKLINAGIETATAAQIINQATPNEIRECDTCALTYIASINKCSVCGGQLSVPMMVQKGNLFSLN